ncbi:hypothetical protein BV509_04805 [Rhodovulum sulfidophilum]|nr:hypothetical protein BV509_04805 [Rhodovulum sulfidophilum]
MRWPGLAANAWSGRSKRSSQRNRANRARAAVRPQASSMSLAAWQAAVVPGPAVSGAKQPASASICTAIQGWRQ